ncbi:hypothetical protein QVD17_30372 [Tagetes erecta]|uniref:Uncharacterized protein n=1 Tax=Tagetes erecta TaxID=13708 RepID=A0AAD8K3J1_TARER|nr:hypothetical protein QVD17_30372 [Tagetes erecta]
MEKTCAAVIAALSAFSSFQSLVHECDSLAGSLAARSEPERISDRLEDPVSNAPLAFNSQGELSASSLVPRGEGPSNSEVGSQYTDTPVIDRDLSLVTGEHSEGKPALAFSTPTGISLGGSSEPLTLSPDHKPLGEPEGELIRLGAAPSPDRLATGCSLKLKIKMESRIRILTQLLEERESSNENL